MNTSTTLRAVRISNFVVYKLAGTETGMCLTPAKWYQRKFGDYEQLPTVTCGNRRLDHILGFITLDGGIRMEDLFVPERVKEVLRSCN
jgi:hypothetical protein